MHGKRLPIEGALLALARSIPGTFPGSPRAELQVNPRPKEGPRLHIPRPQAQGGADSPRGNWPERMDASHLQQWQEQLVELPPLHEADGAFSRAAHLVQQHQDRDLIGRHPVLNAKQVGVHYPVGHHRSKVVALVDAGNDRPSRPAARRAHEPPYAITAPARHHARPGLLPAEPVLWARRPSTNQRPESRLTANQNIQKGVGQT